MAEEILFATLDGNVPLQEVLTWISNETYGPSLQEHLKCSRGDFVLCILNYLRETTGRVWQLSSTFQSPIKSVKKSAKINHLNGQTSPEKSFQKRFARRVELFPTGATNSSNLLDDEKNVSTSKSEVDIIDDTSFANRTRSPNTYSPSPFKEAMGKCSVKQKEDENPFLVPEVSCLATSSPLSTSATSDSFPQHTPINRRVQGFKSNERCSTPVGTNSPDYHFKTPTRGNGMCLGDFLIKGGKSQQSKKRFTLSPTNSPVSSENSSPVDQPSNQSSKKKHKRRINPTKVCLETGPSSAQNGFQDLEAFGSTNRPIPDASPFKTVSMEPIKASLSFTEERNLLKQERLKLQNQGENLVSEATSANCALPTKSALPKMMTVADPLQVTNPDKLLKLCEMYSCVLNANLVPNLMSELYFLISLLVIRHDLSEDENESVTNLEEKMKHASIANLDEQDCNEIVHEPSSVDLSPVRSGKFSAKKPCHYQYFYTVHNCVFFATNVLSKQVDVLGNLDRITLKLLLDSERIAVFSPKLKQNLVSLYNNSVSSGKSSQGVLPNKAIVSNVSFQSDTDNSSNFPSAQCFSNFRKQRDGFYEILRIWEANHQKPGWNFAVTLGSRVRSLLHLCSDPINLMHFARLFRLQLVSIVSGAPNNFDDESQDLQFLEGLRGIDPDKLNRLKDRLVTPYKAGGPRPEPSFPGSQEFYRDFILSASHLSFLQHLQDSLISHLLELDQTSFLASDTEDSEFTVDSTTRQNYLSCVVMMRLLAKFLGLIVFLPYSRADVNLPQNIRETEVFVRSKVMPPLDILRCVVEAHKNHRLIVTIPWVVKFLGMMDSVSSSLPVYQTVIQLLLRLYMDLMRQGTCSSLFRKSVLLPSQTVLLLRLSLGWLFDASFIQETFFHSWCFNLDETLMLTLDAGGTPYFDASLPALDSSDGVSVTSSTAPPVDALNLIDCEVLYALCPFLLELRALLASTSSECAPGGSVRHITPVSAGSSMLPSASSSKQLELKLEDSFFHGLPASVFRTVEFVVERVTSSCVKHICNVWLPSLKQKGILQLQEKIKSYQTDIDSKKDSAEIQMELKKEISSIVDQVSTSLKAKCRTGVAEFCLSKCKGALFSLLSEESLSVPVCEMCVKIASRMSEERVISWMQNHATLTIYSKDLQSETEKAIKNRERCEVSNSTAKTSHIAPGATALWEHDDSAPSPIVVLQSLKIMVCDILSGQDTPRECVDDVLNQMEQCVTKRQDVVPAAERIFALLSVDLIVSLVCHNPCMVDSSLLSRMVGLWKLDALRPVEDGLARLVCPRNMLLLAQSGHQTRLVWEKLAEVVAAVLKADLVTPDLVENQCLAIMQQEWPQNILRCFAMCMNEVVRQYQKQKNVDYKFVLLLEWLAETMAQIDYFPHL